MKFKTSINYILNVFAIIALFITAIPSVGDCAARKGAESVAVAAHSCCAPVVTPCSNVLTSQCCCKAVPINTAATEGLIAYSPTEFVQVGVLEQTPLPANYYAASLLSGRGLVETAPPPKIYIINRSLLI